MKTLAWMILVALGGITVCTAQDVEFITVSRDDEYHESWPDIAIAANGDLVVAYQESEGHGAGPVSTIVSRYSTDLGATWSEKTVVLSHPRRHAQGWINCSKLIRLQDDSLLLVLDNCAQNRIYPEGAHHFWGYQHSDMYLFRSFDNGRSWVGPEATFIHGGVVPSITQLQDGTLLLGITIFPEEKDYRSTMLVYRSPDNGRSWGAAITVAEHPERLPDEGDFVQLPTGEVVCYMRENEASVNNGLKAISRDGGLTWEGLYGSGPWKYCGRSDVGMLSTGEVVLTQRVSAGRFGIYMEPADVALEPTPLDGSPPEGAKWAILDTDTNDHPDYGYSGWVELPDGSIYAVQYITDGAPAGRPFIRGYRIPRSFIDNMGRGESEG
jgi:sialidase-1